MKIVSILDTAEGITLAKTDTDTYMVGIGYKVGQTIDSMTQFDFVATKSEQIARNFFNIKTGGK